MASPLIVEPQYILADCERTANALRDYYLRAHRVAERRMTAQGTSFARHKLLMMVAQQQPVRSIDIAAAMGQAPRTVTEGIDGLERDGLVRRVPDPADRRAKRISLTDAGHAAVRAAEPAREQFIVDLLGALAPKERDELVMLIDKLNARLLEMDADA
jgi:DNA-binding MarR family transcriptional regulator